MDGLWIAEVNPFGPVHAYVVILAGPPVRFRVPPTQTGPLFVAVATGLAGWALMTTLPDAGETHPAALVTVKL